MVKFILESPGHEDGTLSDVAISNTLTTPKVFYLNSSDEPVYIDNFRLRGSIVGEGNTGANSFTIAVFHRRAAANPVSNVTDTINGDEIQLIVGRISKQIGLFVSGQTASHVPFSITQKFMVKLRKGDDLVCQVQSNPGSGSFSANYFFSRADTVKRIMFKKRT